jgi:asparagine synthetase B (glutamine-hydrolysing)
VVGLAKKLYIFIKMMYFFIFASEIKAILVYLKVEKKPNLNFLKNYLKCGCRKFLKKTDFESIYKFDFAHYFERKY